MLQASPEINLIVILSVWSKQYRYEFVRNDDTPKVNRPTMGQLLNVLLAIERAHTVPQRALDCGPGFGELNQVYWPNRPTPSV